MVYCLPILTGGQALPDEVLHGMYLPIGWRSCKGFRQAGSEHFGDVSVLCKGYNSGSPGRELMPDPVCPGAETGTDPGTVKPVGEHVHEQPDGRKFH